MGKCSYCGESAGVFASFHEQCKNRYEFAERDMLARTTSAIKHRKDLETLEADLDAIAARGRVPKDQVRSKIIEGWTAVLDQILSDGLVTSDEESLLAEARESLRLSQDELDWQGAFSRLVKAVVLRDVANGEMKGRVKLESDIGFNFQKSESLLWYFRDCRYLQERVRRQYVGRSAGVSIRVARGVYFRTGAFQGEPVETSSLVAVDQGRAAISSKHVYFGGVRTSFRVPHTKIVSLVPYRDGVGFCRDAANAKQQVLVTGDGWFTYNLLSNVAKVQP